MKNKIFLSILIVSSLTFLVSSTALASELRVDLRTNYLPGVEFTTARAILNPLGRTLNVPFFTTSPVNPASQVFIFNVANGDYRLVVELLRPDESILASRATALTLDHDFSDTILISKPAEPAPTPSFSDSGGSAAVTKCPHGSYQTDASLCPSLGETAVPTGPVLVSTATVTSYPYSSATSPAATVVTPTYTGMGSEYQKNA